MAGQGVHVSGDRGDVELEGQPHPIGDDDGTAGASTTLVGHLLPLGGHAANVPAPGPEDRAGGRGSGAFACGGYSLTTTLTRVS